VQAARHRAAYDANQRAHQIIQRNQPIMRQNALLARRRAVEIAASFAPEAFQDDAFQTTDPETFLERYRTLPEKDQNAITEGLVASFLSLAAWIYTLPNENSAAKTMPSVGFSIRSILFGIT
jgi:hypothetical protein